MVFEIGWDAKALFLSQFLQASATSMHCILGDEVANGQDYHWEKSENQYYEESCQDKEWVAFVFHVSHYFHVAVRAFLLYWAILLKVSKLDPEHEGKCLPDIKVLFFIDRPHSLGPLSGDQVLVLHVVVFLFINNSRHIAWLLFKIRNYIINNLTSSNKHVDENF